MSEIFIKLLNMSISAGWLVLCVVALRLILKKAPRWIACILWALVAVRLLCPFSLESVLSLVPSAETVPEEIIYSEIPEIESGIPIINSTVNPIISDSLAPAPKAEVNPMEIITGTASVIWIIGVAAMAIYAVVSYIRIRKRVSEAIEEEKGVWICDRIDTPFILGLFSPRIILPSSLSGEDREYVVSHEKAHLSRMDHLWKPLGYALLTVYWFNPLIWIGYILLCRDIEAACDEKVIKQLGEGAKKPYAEALINCSVPKKMISACPLAFGETGVKGRVRNVLNYKKPAFLVIIVAIVACIVVAVCFLTDPLTIKSKDMNSFIEEQILERHRHNSGEFCCTDFKILGTKKNDDNIIVYMWVLYQEYDEKNGTFDLVSSSYTPTAIAIMNENSTLSLVEYWEPRDGSYNVEDIRNKFPWYLHLKALDSERYIEKQEVNCLKKAEKYFSSKVENSDVKTYVYHDSPEILSSPQITLSKNDGTFRFSYSVLSSAYIVGSYELTESELILTTDSEDPEVYVFRVVDENTFAFVADRSATIPSYRYGEGEEPQCPVPDGAEFVSEFLDVTLNDWISMAPVITSVEHDINGDGSPEKCTLSPGPTSGVNSLAIGVVDMKSRKRYSDWWPCDLENASFYVEGEKLYICGEMRLSMVDYVCEYESVAMSVTLESGDLVIEKSENDSQIGGFLRIYNYDEKKAEPTQNEIYNVCENMYKKLGRKDSDTGFEYYCVVDSAFEIKGEKYYLIDWKWIVEDEQGNPTHTSQITQYVVSEDFKRLYDAYFEDDGILKVYNKRNIMQ